VEYLVLEKIAFHW